MKEILEINESRSTAAGQEWLETLRREARAQFEAQGYPTTRNEDWRHTNITAMVGTNFQRAPKVHVSLTPDEFAHFAACPVAGNRIVFVNGRYAPEHTQTDRLPHGVRVASIAETLETNPEALAPWLGRYSPAATHPFAALNGANFEDGAFLHIGRGCVTEDPIVLLHLSTAPDGPTVAYPRHLIVAEDGSVASVVEVYAGISQDVYQTNAVTEIFVGEGAVLDHYKIQRESAHAYHVGDMSVHQEGKSTFSSHSVSMGGKLARNDVLVRIDGEYSEATLHGLAVVADGRHVDNHTYVDHAKPNGTSHETYHGVVEGKSRNVFCGRVMVRPDAQKTDARQQNRNLLLSREAVADSMPQLEIFADDVKCTHGATVGALDDDAAFYLRARGIPEKAARGLLTYAFANEILDGIRIDALRTRLQHKLLERFTSLEEAS